MAALARGSTNKQSTAGSRKRGKRNGDWERERERGTLFRDAMSPRGARPDFDEAGAWLLALCFAAHGLLAL
jgi:hypothetical protein